VGVLLGTNGTKSIAKRKRSFFEFSSSNFLLQGYYILSTGGGGGVGACSCRLLGVIRWELDMVKGRRQEVLQLVIINLLLELIVLDLVTRKTLKQKCYDIKSIKAATKNASLISSWLNYTNSSLSLLLFLLLLLLNSIAHFKSLLFSLLQSL
jgi:hypothetical protein